MATMDIKDCTLRSNIRLCITPSRSMQTVRHPDTRLTQEPTVGGEKYTFVVNGEVKTYTDYDRAYKVAIRYWRMSHDPEMNTLIDINYPGMRELLETDSLIAGAHGLGADLNELVVMLGQDRARLMQQLIDGISRMKLPPMQVKTNVIVDPDMDPNKLIGYAGKNVVEATIDTEETGD